MVDEKAGSFKCAKGRAGDVSATSYPVRNGERLLLWGLGPVPRILAHQPHFIHRLTYTTLP